jgi:DNA-binding beta-propeller fold protein YncE
VNRATDMVYVSGDWSDIVTVINGASDRVISSLSIGNVFNVGWIAVNPTTNTVYVAATAH